MTKSKFEKKDLQTGMITEDTIGNKYLVLVRNNKVTFLSQNRKTFIDDDHILSDLTHVCLLGYGMIKVYEPRLRNFNDMFSDCNNETLIWERKPKKKMTVSEIERELGYEVEIVRE